MKKRFLLMGMLSASFFSNGQATDSLYEKRTISKTDVQVLFSYYTQDGNHSAVTGGTGTEKLNVYAPAFHIENIFKQYNTISLDGGVDVISSASTDNIDFVVSSASKVDARSHLQAAFKKRSKKNNFEISAGTGFSIESDYFSIPALLSIAYSDSLKIRTYSFSFEAYFDDLRWGRYSKGLFNPEKLIYPVELRYKVWYDEYKRNTYNFKFGFSQVINSRLVMALFPEIIYQQGLLATPFHRVYFKDDSLRVENLPDKRVKFSAGLQTNYFASSRFIFRTGYNLYTDNFGIVSHALSLETPVKITPRFSLTPLFRIYAQSESKYFNLYKEHLASDEFYTSDYDLSNFTSVKAGIGFRFAPFYFIARKFFFNEIELRYARYLRSDGLKANSVSLVMDFF